MGNNKEDTKGVASHTRSIWTASLLAIFSVAFFVLVPQEFTQKLLERISALIPAEPPSATMLREGHLMGSACDVDQYLTEWSTGVPGFHVICVTQEASGLGVTMYLNGMRGEQHKKTFPSSTETFEEDLQNAFPPSGDVIPMYKNGGRQPWSIYSPDGFRLFSAGGNNFDVVLAAGVSFVFEGGVWIPPGIKVGHRQTLHNMSSTDGGKVELETLSMRPLVFLVEGFLYEEECDMIRELSAPHVRSSSVSLMDKDKGKASTEWRTSSTYWLSSRDKSWLQQIDGRVADLTRVPKSHQEDVQVLRYELAQKYDNHHDYFNPSAYANDAGTIRMTKNGAKNRLVTVFWYMSTVHKGGHTYFPRAGNLPHPSTNKCPPHDAEHQGLKVPSVKGNVIMFYNLLPNGGLDELSTHGGCPVEEGTKWSGNKWVWNEPRH